MFIKNKKMMTDYNKFETTIFHTGGISTYNVIMLGEENGSLRLIRRQNSSRKLLDYSFKNLFKTKVHDSLKYIFSS